MKSKYICLHSILGRYSTRKVLIKNDTINYIEEYVGDNQRVKSVIEVNGRMPILAIEDIETIRKMLEGGE